MERPGIETVIETERLRLRPFRAGDAADFAALNGDPLVMAHFPKPLNRAESDRVLARIMERREAEGVAFAAVELRDSGAFVGMAGLAFVRFEAPVRGMTEIGWRLLPGFWGKGLASEAARAWRDHGFRALGLERIVSFTTRGNLRSQAVMRRIGMQRAPALDFEHPALAPGDPLRRHVVFTGVARGA